MDSLSTGQKEMSTKMDGMASKKDLQELRKEVTKETKGIVSDAVHPLKSDLCEIRTRVAKLESAPIPGNSSAAPATMSAEVKSILDSLDPAHKQIVFSGFPEKLPHAERIQLIQLFLNGIPDTPPLKTSGIIYKGPRNNRQETKMSFIEYGSTDDARALLKKIKELPCILGGQNIKIKAGLTKVNGARNYHLGEAARIITEFSKTYDSSVVQITIGWKERIVKRGLVDILFQQKNDELKGTFGGIAAHLKFT